MLHSLRHLLPRIGRLPRLCAAGVCLLLALASALGAGSGPGRSSVPVLVAAHDLPAGHVLGRADLAVGRWPPGLRPADARAAPAQAIGQRLAGPLRAREPITSARLVGRGLSSGLPGDQVAVPVMLDDPHSADLVHAGDRIDLLETPRPDGRAQEAAPSSPQVSVVASDTLVLAVLPATDGVRGDDGDTAGSGAELIVGVPRPIAVRITRDSTAQTFTVVLDAP